MLRRKLSVVIADPDPEKQYRLSIALPF